MLISMTGFGQATLQYNNKNISVEIRSLNSKGLDLSLRMPSQYKQREIELRSEITRRLERGKIDVSIRNTSTNEERAATINPAIVRDYYNQLNSLGFQTDREQLLAIIMGLPGVMQESEQTLSDEEWAAVMDTFQRAAEQFHNFRCQEGNALAADIIARVGTIQQLLSQIPQYEPQRIERVRKRINDGLAQFFDATAIDRNRLEQEIVFYIERFDINEEKVRLANHCKYFINTTNEPENSGRKLGFIAQEIGREINTIGSKANDADIQRLVVLMKDELEKIKEQLMNIV